jgi:glycosyltransferase involved in cell wall biosynthesis
MLVSIMIPAFKPAYFRQSLTSALAQTWDDVEIIVSDDCPTEEIKHLCEPYSGLVKYYRNPEPGGYGINNLLHLARISKGEYIKCLFDDDILSPFCVQYLVEALEETASKNTKLAFSTRMTITPNNHSIDVMNAFGVTERTILNGEDVIKRLAMTLKNPIGELTTVLFRRSDIIKHDGSLAFMTIDDVQCLGLGDVALFSHLCCRGNAVIVPETLSYFRLHPQSNSNHEQFPNWPCCITDWRMVIDLAVKKGLLDKDEIFTSYQFLAQNVIAWRVAYPGFSNSFNEFLNQLSEDAENLPITKSARERLRAAINENPNRLENTGDSTSSKLKQFLKFFRSPSSSK